MTEPTTLQDLCPNCGEPCDLTGRTECPVCFTEHLTTRPASAKHTTHHVTIIHGSYHGRARAEVTCPCGAIITIETPSSEGDYWHDADAILRAAYAEHLVLEAGRP